MQHYNTDNGSGLQLDWRVGLPAGFFNLRRLTSRRTFGLGLHNSKHPSFLRTCAFARGPSSPGLRPTRSTPCPDGGPPSGHRGFTRRLCREASLRDLRATARRDRLDFRLRTFGRRAFARHPKVAPPTVAPQGCWCSSEDPEAQQPVT